MAKDFTTAAKAAAASDDDEDVIEFSITTPITVMVDGEMVTKKQTDTFWARYPTDTQIALYSASFGDDGKDLNMMGATIQFLRDVLEKDSYTRMMDKLHDRDDPTEVETLQEILEYLFEEVAARPTVLSSDSSPSPRPGGQRLTDHLPAKASTRSPSRRVASSISSTRGSSKG
jgi:hypothetical protein